MHGASKQTRRPLLCGPRDAACHVSLNAVTKQESKQEEIMQQFIEIYLFQGAVRSCIIF